MRIASGKPIAVYTLTNDQIEFNIESFFIKRNRGTIPSLMGIIMPKRKKKNNAPFQRNGYLAI
ncbi:hypothetical protein D3C87_2133730 [compost metagenome]